jgi:hypothetical protein
MNSWQSILGGLLPVLCWGGSSTGISAAEVHRNGRFETAFTSATDYTNAVLDVRVAVEFRVPGGPPQTVDAFWDGGRTWRARFSPEKTGEWSFTTTCSDPANPGLHGQKGAFTCVPYRGNNPLYRHGSLRVAADRHHLEHADGTPFFWLADTAWAGPLLSDADDWSEFLRDRVKKGFNAVQFMGTHNIAAAANAQGRPAFKGRERIVLDPVFFQRLDSRVDALNAAGLLAVPTFAWAAQWDTNALSLNPGAWLPDDQLVALGRYFTARYGAHQVVWMFAGDDWYLEPEMAGKWRQRGRAIFGEHPTRLVTVHNRSRWLGKREFSGEPWLGFVSYQSGHRTDAPTFNWLLRGEMATQWNEPPLRPILNNEPIYEGHHDLESKRPATARDVRQAVWWSLLVAPTAGTSYGAHGVWSWEETTSVPLNHPRAGPARPWREAMHFPGSAQMGHVRKFFAGLDWWKLRPAPTLLTRQPGDARIQDFVGAALTTDRRTAVFYFPAQVTAELNPGTLGTNPRARWFDPVSGRFRPAKLAGSVVTPPGPNAAGDPDWVLAVGVASSQSNP